MSLERSSIGLSPANLLWSYSASIMVALTCFATAALPALGQGIEQRLNDLRNIAQPGPLAELPSDETALPPDWLGIVSWNIQVGGVSTSESALRPPMVRSALGRLLGGSYQVLAAQEISGTANAAALTSMLPMGTSEWSALFNDTADAQDNGFWLRSPVSAVNFSSLFTLSATDSSGRPLVDSTRTTHPPAVASFTAGDFDFTLITLHLTFADGQTQESAREFGEILNFLDAYFQTPGYDPDVVVCGDFNIPTRLSGQAGSGGIVLDPIFEDDPRFRIGDRRLVATVHEPTSRAPAAQGGDARNSYDHFIFSVDVLEEFIQARRVAPETLTADPEDPELRLTSDHFPVIALFRTAGPNVRRDNPSQPSAITSVVNGASFREGIAAGSWISVFGSELAPATRIWRDGEIVNGTLPTSLEDVTVLVNGRPAATFFISPTQLNVQAPDDNALGPVTLEVRRGGVTQSTVMTELRLAAPGLFVFDPQQRKYLAAVHLDGTFVGPERLFGDAVATRPARPGEVVLLFGTGFGPTNPPVPAGRVFSGAAPLQNPARVLMGGIQSDLLFAGLSGAGLNQLNVRIPESVIPGDVEIIAEILGFQTQAGAFLRVEGSGTVPAPTVALNVIPASIPAGMSATLMWNSTNAQTVEITPGIGGVSTSGSRIVSPTATTTYTITATGAGGTASRSVTLTVTSAPAPTVALNVIPASIPAGMSATLMWNSTNAQSVEITPAIGVVSASGSRIVSPTATTTYTITATGAGGTASRSVTLTVTSALAPTVDITASPQTIQAGQSATLQWISTNATTVSINQGIGTVATSGSRIVSPSQTTTYTITAQGPGGTRMDSVTVTVTSASAPTVDITASPQTIQAGQSATLQWVSTSATTVSINQGIGTVATSGSRIVSPSQTTTYTITAQGSGGTRSDSVTVTVSNFGPCGSKTTCGQMVSCAEAQFYLNVCKVTSLDGDSDGVPCESICSGG